jgi:hypothetical protein
VVTLILTAGGPREAFLKRTEITPRRLKQNIYFKKIIKMPRKTAQQICLFHGVSIKAYFIKIICKPC